MATDSNKKIGAGAKSQSSLILTEIKKHPQRTAIS